MLKRQLNKFAMVKNTSAFLSEYEEIISVIPELQNYHSELRAKCEEIESKDTERIVIRQGRFLNKMTERNEAINKALGISGAVFAYARKIKDIELERRSYILRSELNNMRDMELASKLKYIKELAEGNMQLLNSFGVDARKMNSYIRKIALYEKAVEDSASSFAVKKGNLKVIRELFKETDSILTAIDKLTDSFLEEYPGFVNNYRILRRIKNFGIRHRKVPVTQTIQSDSTPDY